MNRLQLDFSIQNRLDRVDFAKNYLNTIKFEPTEDELDTIAKYILWGKDEETGLNGRQEGLELETRYGTWDSDRIESLDALIENPAFSEAMLRGPSDLPTKVPRKNFSRTEARKFAPPHILNALESIWHEIDETELLLNYYEIKCGKRLLPPRQPLLDRISISDQTSLQARAQSLQPYAYLKLKHRLVDLRREQYTYRDSYMEEHQTQPTFNYIEEINPTFGTEITVRPLGLISNDPLSQKIFNEDRFPEPLDFTEADLSNLSKILWRPAPSSREFFDFGNPDHLYQLFGMWDEITSQPNSIYSNLEYFARTAMFYKKLAHLEPILEEIFEAKLSKQQNQDIANHINRKYGKNYRSNYISTLYCKKCLGLIAETAKKHREVLENVFFPENFKKCKDCGRSLLMCEDNFVKRARSNDGFSPRCKKCEKIKRDKRKEN